MIFASRRRRGRKNISYLALPPLSIPAKAGISSRASGKFREAEVQCRLRRCVADDAAPRDSRFRGNGRGSGNGKGRARAKRQSIVGEASPHDKLRSEMLFLPLAKNIALAGRERCILCESRWQAGWRVADGGGKSDNKLLCHCWRKYFLPK